MRSLFQHPPSAVGLLIEWQVIPVRAILQRIEAHYLERLDDNAMVRA